MKIDIKGWTVNINRDMFILGVVDGENHISEHYFLVAQDPFGARWMHDIKFDKEVREITPDGHVFHDVKASALKAVENLLDRVQKRGYIDDTFWSEIDPAYGSEAYQRQWVG
mgnify:CR=1 FL=1